MRESKIEQHLHQRIRDLGGDYRRVQWIGRKHANDDLVMLPKKSCFVECKRNREAPTDGQSREHRRMRRAGLDVYWVQSTEEIDALFPAPLVPHRGPSLLEDPNERQA